MRKILHLQIPLKNKKINNNFAITPEYLGQFMKWIQEKVGDEFIVIASPCLPGLIGEDNILYNIDLTQINIKNLRKVLGENNADHSETS
jgi:hypothetical protein